MGRYDVEVAVATFSGRLRSEIDLESLSGELLQLVDDTLQPSRTHLWLRPRGARSEVGRARSSTSWSVG